MKRYIIEKLLEWKKNSRRKPLILRGVRQSGKTYILQEFGAKHFEHTHYVNFEKNKAFHAIFEENLDPKKIVEKLNFGLNTSIDIRHDLLIFDEIQACPRALTSLKYFAEEMPELALCSAGSLLGIHLGPISFPVGKVNFLNMYPMSFREFLLALNEERAVFYLDEARITKEIPEIVHAHLWERLKWFFITGGLPEVVQTFVIKKENLFDAFVAVRAVQQQLILAYFADMAKHSGKINAMHLDRLWRAVPEQLARSQDGSSKKFTFKDAVPGINRYDRLVGAIDWLEKAGLIFKVNIVSTGQLPFSAYARENIFKLFCFDIGILGALSDLSPKEILDQDYGSFKGYAAENFVAQEFFCSEQNPLYSWQEKTAEIEFLRQFDGSIVPIEVKSGWVTHAKSLHLFAAKYKSPFRIIFSARNLSIDERLGIWRLPLYMAFDLPNVQFNL